MEKNKEKDELGRRTGSGITDLGDTIAALNIRYGSDQSIEMTNDIYKELAKGCWRSSLELAAERGCFPIFSYEREADHPFVSRVMNELTDKHREMWKTTGRRNIALTTTAPAGTVSILTQTTSGLEPVFMLSYKRRRKINPFDESSKVDFVDHMGDKWQEYIVYHHALKQWSEATGRDISEYHDSPYHLATANEIDWTKKIDLQAAAQKWVCHSLSNTCVSGDTLIETNDGLLYIDEIAKNENCEEEGKPTPISNLTTRNHLGETVKISHVVNNGTKKVHRLITKSGFSISATPDHEFLILNDEDGMVSWKKLEDIIIGDLIKLS